MKSVSITLPGYYETKTCETIKEKLQGLTYHNFDVQYGGTAGNNQIIVVGEVDESESEKDLESMFIFVALTELAKR